MRMRLVTIVLLLSVAYAQAQRKLSLQEALQRVQSEHPALKAAQSHIQQEERLRAASFDLPKTSVVLTHGQYNSYIRTDNNYTITQTLPFPTVWTSQHKLASASVKVSESHSDVVKSRLTFQVKELFQKIQFHVAYQALLVRRDSLYTILVKAARLRYTTGEAALLEKTAMETQQAEAKNQLRQNEEVTARLKAQLQQLLLLDEPVDVSDAFVRMEAPASIPEGEQNPEVQLSAREAEVAAYRKKVEAAKMLPDLTLGYFNQSLTGFQNINGNEVYYGAGKRFQGYTVGIAIPLAIFSHTAAIKAAAYGGVSAQQQHEAEKLNVKFALAEAWQTMQSNMSNLDYYERSALQNAQLLEMQSTSAYQQGEIDYSKFLVNLQQVLIIRENYLKSLLAFNVSIITLEYLNGNP